MLPSLPSLAPRDSYNLWYTPTHHTSTPSYHEASNNSQHHDQFLSSTTHASSNQNHGPQSARRPHQNATHRTPLSRLVADETYQARRKANIQNYGNSWLRPPGVPKSLFQIREEEREVREHLEAVRREQLAQELADAEAAAVNELIVPGDDGMGMEEVRDLDDDIPEGEGLGGLDDEEEELEDEEDEDEEEEDDEDSDVDDGTDRAVESDIRRVVASRMGDPFGINNGFGGDESELGEEEEGQMLQEEDFVHEHGGHVGDGDTDMGGMDMDADLDEDVPNADLGGYEHTDTEEEDSSSEDESVDIGRLPPLQTNLVSSMVRSDGTQNSIELLGSDSLQGSSPRQRTTRSSRGRTG